jgi:DNA-binding transcriptional LysR family regulator
MYAGLEAVPALRGTDRGAGALVVVGALASTTERLRRFRDAHPAIDLRLRTALGREVSDLVRRGDATLGLRYDADPNPETVSTAIHGDAMVPVCSPRHRLARVQRVGATALAGEQNVSLPSAWPIAATSSNPGGPSSAARRRSCCSRPR